MSETSIPWPGIYPGDAGPYTTPNWSKVWAAMSGAAKLAEQGVFLGQANELNITAIAAPTVTIGTGLAMVDGTWYYTDTGVGLTIPVTAAQPRIDRIVLRKDFTLQTIRITRIAGVENATPAVPGLTQNAGVTWDLPLWQIYCNIAAVSKHVDERRFIGVADYFNQYRNDSGARWGQDGDDFVNLATNKYTIATVDGSQGVILDNNAFGAYKFVSAVGAAGGMTIFTPVTRGPTNDYNRLAIRVATPASHANVNDRIGWFSAAPTSATPDPAEGVYFRRNGAGNWYAVCRTGGLETAVDTAVAPSTSYKVFSIEVVPGAVAFYVNAVWNCTIRTNLPATGTGLGFAAGITYAAAPTAADRLYIDFWRWLGRSS